MIQKKPWIFLLFLTLIAGLLSACSGRSFTASSWPGISTDGERIYASFGPHVYAVNAADGREIWKFPTEPERNTSFFAAPAPVNEDQILVGGYNNILYSLNPQTGEQSGWKFEEAKGIFVASPLVTDEGIFAPSSDNNLYALDFQGNLLWEPFTTQQAQWAQPASDGKRIYLTSLNHHLYALDITNGKPIWSQDLGSASAGQPTLGQGVLYVGTFANQVMALNTENGDILWNFETRGWVWYSPALNEGVLYFGDLSGQLYFVDAASGTALRDPFQADGPIFGTPLVVSETVIFATENGSVVALTLEGEKRWELSLAGSIHAGPLAAGERIIIASMENNTVLHLTALDSEGTILWRYTPVSEK